MQTSGNAAGTPAVRTEALTKSYGNRTALRRLDLTVPAGTVFGYLGPNGAGKTTTIRLLAVLLRPSAGAAYILGHDVRSQREVAQALIGYLPGDFVAYPKLTGRHYLAYLSRLRGWLPWSAVQPLVDRLDADIDTPIGQLSHGNRQKLGIVQAFMHDPAVLILDEPTAGLDPLVQRQFLDLVRERRGAGRTVFLSSHVLSEVQAVADVVGMLRAGELLLVDSVDRLKREQRTRLELSFDCEPPLEHLQAIPGVTDVSAEGSTVRLLMSGSASPLFAAAAPFGINRVVSREQDLEDIFLDYYGREASHA